MNPLRNGSDYLLLEVCLEKGSDCSGPQGEVEDCNSLDTINTITWETERLSLPNNFLGIRCVANQTAAASS